MNPCLIHYGQKQIRHRRALRVLDMAAALHPAIGAASHQYGKRRMVMNVAVAHRASIKNERMIQQIAVSIRRGFQPFEKVSDQAYMVSIDFTECLQFFWTVLMVRCRMENF